MSNFNENENATFGETKTGSMRKLRTRQHVLEDLSFNFAEKQVLLGSHQFNKQPDRQYSYDGVIYTFNDKGEIENGVIYVQIKSTDNIFFSKQFKGYRVKLEKRDLELWINEFLPVLVVLYDGNSDQGYYVELHEYFKHFDLSLKGINKYKNIYIHPSNIFDAEVVKKYRITKNSTYGNY